jgi:hypothetical protein
MEVVQSPWHYKKHGIAAQGNAWANSTASTTTNMKSSFLFQALGAITLVHAAPQSQSLSDRPTATSAPTPSATNKAPCALVSAYSDAYYAANPDGENFTQSSTLY